VARLARFSVWPGHTKGLPRETTQSYGDVPPKPDSFPGNEVEWRVWWWLDKNKLEFDFQSSLLGGRLMLGGQVADFIIYSRDPALIINVQGEHWHYAGSHLSAEALMNKVALMNRGFDVVYVLERDVNDRLNYAMREAMLGRQLFSDV
jgi:hypothetical protein